MAIVKAIWFDCDECGTEITDWQWTVALARKDLRESGGKSKDGWHFCADCWEKKHGSHS